jgi:hypothetical protein
MEKVQRDVLTSHIDALGVELRIARVTLPGIKDGLNIARVSAFTDCVKRIADLAAQLATATNGTTHPVQEEE